MQKRVAKTLIKPGENEDFGAPFSKIALKMIKKHYLEKVFTKRFQNVAFSLVLSPSNCLSGDPSQGWKSVP